MAKVLTERIEKLYKQGKIDDKGLQKAVDRGYVTAYMAEKIKKAR